MRRTVIGARLAVGLGAALAIGLVIALVAIPRLRAPRPAVSASDEAAAGAGEVAAGAGVDTTSRERTLRFWELYRQATARRVGGRTREAAADYARALELNPRHEDVLYYLGNMDFELGEYEAAEDAWRRLIAVNPVSARAHSRLGDLYMCPDLEEFFDLDAAEAEFERAHRINREETGPPLRLGQIALLRGDLEAALGYLDAVIGSNYSSVEAHYLRAYIAWKRGDEGQAEQSLAQAASFVRPEEAAAGAPSGMSQEGDTRSGAAPVAGSMARSGGHCEAVLYSAQMPALGDSARLDQAEPGFRRLDRSLAEARARIPS